jgi:hypothetical protein
MLAQLPNGVGAMTGSLCDQPCMQSNHSTKLPSTSFKLHAVTTNDIHEFI